MGRKKMSSKVNTGCFRGTLCCLLVFVVFFFQVQAQWVYKVKDSEEDENIKDVMTNIDDVDDSSGFFVPLDDVLMHNVKRYFLRAPWMSVPLIPRNFERREEAPRMTLMSAPFDENFKKAEGRTLLSASFDKAEGRTPWISMLETPVKRDFKKMDGKLRILKHS